MPQPPSPVPIRTRERLFARKNRVGPPSGRAQTALLPKASPVRHAWWVLNEFERAVRATNMSRRTSVVDYSGMCSPADHGDDESTTPAHKRKAVAKTTVSAKKTRLDFLDGPAYVGREVVKYFDGNILVGCARVRVCVGCACMRAAAPACVRPCRRAPACVRQRSSGWKSRDSSSRLHTHLYKHHWYATGMPRKDEFAVGGVCGGAIHGAVCGTSDLNHGKGHRRLFGHPKGRGGDASLPRSSGSFNK